MKKSILVCLAALALLSAAPGAAFAQGGREARRKEEVVAHLKKARSENRRVIIHFKEGYDVTGRVGELRERGFTFEPDSKDDADILKGAAILKGTEMVVGILYEDVAGVQHPSKVRKFFKGLRTGAIGVGAFFVIMPVYGVQALLGNLPDC